MLYPVIALPPLEAGGDQVSCTPLPLAGRAVRLCGAPGVVAPCGVAVAVAVLVAVAVAVDVGVLLATGVAVGVEVLVAVAVAVGVGVGAPPQEANLKLPMRVRQLNWDEPDG